MTRLRLIRHAAACEAGEESDPGLALTGARQALGLADDIRGDCPVRLLSSPLRRARETAMPLSAVFGLEREIDPVYAELPWRTGQSAAGRMDELRHELGAQWSDLDAERRDWRARLIAHALRETGDVAIVTHFVAINVLVGAATGADRVTVFRPANASITEIAVSGGTMRLVKMGAQDPADVE
jgi:broad specificity phosphatase PhoE